MSSYIVTCIFCGTANRIPADKEGLTGHCGTCHKDLAPLYYRPKTLTDSTFDAFIKDYNGPVVAEFWAPWCPHCTAFESTVKKVAEKLAGKVAVVQINTQNNPLLAGRFNVRGIPALFLLRQGRIIDQLSGAQSSGAIISWFQRHT